MQRTVVQYLDVSAEVDKNVFQELIYEGMRDQISRKHLQCYFKLWEIWSTLCTSERVRAESTKLFVGSAFLKRSQVFDMPRTSCRGRHHLLRCTVRCLEPESEAEKPEIIVVSGGVEGRLRELGLRREF